MVRREASAPWVMSMLSATDNGGKRARSMPHAVTDASSLCAKCISSNARSGRLGERTALRRIAKFPLRSIGGSSAGRPVQIGAKHESDFDPPCSFACDVTLPYFSIAAALENQVHSSLRIAFKRQYHQATIRLTDLSSTILDKVAIMADMVSRFSSPLQ